MSFEFRYECFFVLVICAIQVTFIVIIIINANQFRITVLQNLLDSSTDCPRRYLHFGTSSGYSQLKIRGTLEEKNNSIKIMKRLNFSLQSAVHSTPWNSNSGFHSFKAHLH